MIAVSLLVSTGDNYLLTRRGITPSEVIWIALLAIRGLGNALFIFETSPALTAPRPLATPPRLALPYGK